MEKIILISLKQNFTPNTLGCYGLMKNPVSRRLNSTPRGQQLSRIWFLFAYSQTVIESVPGTSLIPSMIKVITGVFTRLY